MSLSNETVCEILAGEIPAEVARGLRLAVQSSTKFIDETIESLAMEENRSTAPVRILQNTPSRQPTEGTQKLQLYSEPEKKGYDGIRRSEPNWVQCPSDSADPRVLKFRKHFRVLRGNNCQYFRVTKAQLVKKQVQNLRFHCCSQTRGVVHLFADSRLGIESGVFRIQNLHPDFDGSRVGQRSSDRGSFDFLVETKLFTKDKKTFRDGELAFLGVLEDDAALYEITRISADNYPSATDDIGDLSYESSESEEEVMESQPAVVYQPVSPVQHPVSRFSYPHNPKTGAPAAIRTGPGLDRPGYEKVMEYITNQLASNPEDARRVLLALQKAFKQEEIVEAFQEAGLLLDDCWMHQSGGTQRLRPYQQDAVEIVMNPGNFLLYAATGSGKTRIFIEVAKRILESKKDARVVVVIPKLALTTQHAKDFEQNLQGSGDFTVHTFCSATTGQWLSKWMACSVAITTADYLANRLYKGEIQFSEIDLLILDEAHQAKGDSPYCNIMHLYSSCKANGYEIPTKVFGVTATPMHGSNRDRMDSNFSSLLEVLHVPQRHFVVIADNNEVIAQIIPQARPETIELDPRVVDHQFIEFMASFLRHLTTMTLPEFFSSHGLNFLNEVAPPSTYAVAEGSDSKSQFQQWNGTLKRSLETHNIIGFARKDVEYALSTICSIQESVDNCRDVGFEETLSDFNEQLKQKERDFKGFQSVLGRAPSPERSLFLKLQALIDQNPSLLMFNKPTSNAGLISPDECGNFPKFAKLLEILQNYTNREDVHGMVFVRTRLAADWIWKALRKSSLHPNFHFMKIVGRARRSDPQRSEAAGMDLQRQNEVLEEFRKAGRKILVSTSVSEEGINVASCDLIIRYNVALSGTEYKQSLGRARKRDARFVNIVEKGSKEYLQLRRATTEEQESKRTIMMQPEALHIT